MRKDCFLFFFLFFLFIKLTIKLQLSLENRIYSEEGSFYHNV